MLVVNSGHNSRQANQVEFYRNDVAQTKVFSNLRKLKEFNKRAKSMIEAIQNKKKLKLIKYFASAIKKDR